jgi:subtilisin family serine protease
MVSEQTNQPKRGGVRPRAIALSIYPWWLLLVLLVVPSCSNDPSSPNGGTEGALQVIVPRTAVAGSPFVVTVNATGGDANAVEGSVALSVSGGTVSPADLEMSAGVAEAEIVIDGVAGTVKVEASLGSARGEGTIHSLATPALFGDPDALVADHTPRIPYEYAADDFSDDHPEAPGMLISHNTLLILPALDATIGEINLLLDASDAIVVGANPGNAAIAAGPLSIRIPAADHAALDALAAELRDDPSILAAAPDVAISPTFEPRSVTDVPSPGWVWDMPPADGNWGLELTRAPLMWNLNASLRKQSTSVPTGVIDNGFSAHPDLTFANTPAVAATHGTHVAGIIGAQFDNKQGVDGMNPFASMTGITLEGDIFDELLGRLSWGDMMHDGFEALTVASPGVQVANMSLAYNWSQGSNGTPCGGTNTNNSAYARTVARNQGLIFDAFVRIQDFVGQMPILVVAAGNDSACPFGFQAAQWASPMCNAALEHGNPNILVVESVALSSSSPGGATRSPFSNIGGHVSAPGSDIVSTVPGTPAYESLSGTSMATPQVTGLVGYLLAIDPSLTVSDVRTLLDENGVVIDGGGAAKRIDAYATALDIDNLRGNNAILKRLCDIDDGTVDGNTRVDPFSGAIVSSEDVDGDGDTGDGMVDMSDFRRWRDWYLQVAGATGLSLDGAPDHPKRDIDGDHEVEDAVDESIFARSDFNGDNSLDLVATAYVPGTIDAEVTDLAMLERVFDDPDVGADELSGLVESGDLHVSALLAYTDPRVSEVECTISDGTGPVTSRLIPETDPVEIFTLPADSTTYTALFEAIDATGAQLVEEMHTFKLLPGEDLPWEPNAIEIAIELDFPSEIPRGEVATLGVRAGLIEATGDTTRVAGLDVLVAVDAGSIAPTTGVTDAGGHFGAVVTHAVAASSVRVFATVTTPEGTSRTATATATITDASITVTSGRAFLSSTATAQTFSSDQFVTEEDQADHPQSLSFSRSLNAVADATHLTPDQILISAHAESEAQLVVTSRGPSSTELVDLSIVGGGSGVATWDGGTQFGGASTGLTGFLEFDFLVEGTGVMATCDGTFDNAGFSLRDADNTPLLDAFNMGTVRLEPGQYSFRADLFNGTVSATGVKTSNQFSCSMEVDLSFLPASSAATLQPAP